MDSTYLRRLSTPPRIAAMVLAGTAGLLLLTLTNPSEGQSKGDLGSVGVGVRATDGGALTDHAVSLARNPDGARSLAPTVAPKGGPVEAATQETSLDGVDSIASVWAIVDDLDQLAAARTDYHARAIAPIQRLERILGQLQKGTEADRTVVDALVAEVIRDEGRDPLVRGAVWLASADHVEAGLHREVFADWLHRATLGSGELARAALLAASRRSSASTCAGPIDLVDLLQADVPPQITVPGLYPLAFEGALEGPEADSLAAWVGFDDPRRERLATSLPADLMGSNGAELFDYLVTAEMGFVLWGLGGAESDEIATQVVAELQLDGVDLTRAPLLARTAALLTHSLGDCSGVYFDAILRLDSSKHPMHRSLNRLFLRRNRGPISLAQMAQIERLKYTTDSAGEAELIVALNTVENQVANLADADPLRRQETLDYLSMISTDVLVPGDARALALKAIAKSGAWEEFRVSAERVLGEGGSLELHAIAIFTLYDNARQDPERASVAIAALQRFRSGRAPATLISSIDEFIRRLDSI
ncbi:hypothetical protein [Engelhardtia mirabilis]|uniref:Uncharacterized protein n=1 Tax=Engelhardtia mirabilis TaxID=2528011 RepID=A0A518BM16_9BACT|nr:hypothetical protein Pla133_30770 [Planctomycetes bacterium Pla133]QDV02312.1 hypothetical protein Pla86_30760 [Planctomycetes bacterium Pla86]